MAAEIEIIETPDQITECFRAIHELRPNIASTELLLQQAQRQLQAGYIMAGIRGSSDFVSVVGYRFFESLAYGKIVKIDDLVTLPEARGLGHGGRLIDYVKQRALESQCNSIHLDTGYTRHLAHRLYLDKGFEFSCHHLALRLDH